MLRTLVVFAILIPGLAAACTNRFAALLLYIWFAVFRPQDWVWIDINGLRLSLVLSVLMIVPWAWLASTGPTRSIRERLANEALPNLTHPLSIGMVLFMITALVAQTNAVNADVGWLWIDYLWRVLLVSLVTVTMVSTEWRLTAVVTVAAGSMGFHAAKAGVASLAGGGVRFSDGLGGAFIDNNGYALGVVMIIFLLVAASQNVRQKWMRWGLLAAAVPSAYTVISTFSRAGFLAIVTATVVFAALQRRRAAALLALSAIAGLAYAFVPMPKGYLDRLQTIQTYDQIDESSAQSRLHFWKVAMVMVDANPQGVGLRNYDAAFNTYDFSGGRYGTGRSVHSSHFQVLAEQGYAGAAVWAGMFAFGLYTCLKVRNRSWHPALAPSSQRCYFTMANALAASMMGFVVGGAFIALSLNDLTWLTFGLVAALDRLQTKALAAPARAPARVEPAASSGARDLGMAIPAFQGSYRKRIPAAGGSAVASLTSAPRVTS